MRRSGGERLRRDDDDSQDFHRPLVPDRSEGLEDGDRRFGVVAERLHPKRLRSLASKQKPRGVRGDGLAGLGSNDLPEFVLLAFEFELANELHELGRPAPGLGKVRGDHLELRILRDVDSFHPIENELGDVVVLRMIGGQQVTQDPLFGGGVVEVERAEVSFPFHCDRFRGTK